jgi:hypothetical protein
LLGGGYALALPHKSNAAELLLHSTKVPSIELLPKIQSQLSALIDKVTFGQLFEKFDDSGRARLLSLSAPHSLSWLSVLPSTKLGLKLSPEEFVTSIGLTLGLKIFPQEFKCPAESCKQKMDVYGTHAILCACSGDRIKRHNALRNCLREKLSSACLSPVLEPKHILRDSGKKPADILVPDYHLGRDACLDIAITCPIQDKYCSKAAQIQSFSADDYAQNIKIPKYSNVIANESLMFIPIIFETFGALNTEGYGFLEEVVRRNNFRRGDSLLVKSHSNIQLYQSLGVCLQRHNARMVNSRRPRGVCF